MLSALPPEELRRLVLEAVDPYVDRDILARQVAREVLRGCAGQIRHACGTASLRAGCTEAEIIAMILRRWRYAPGENLARWTKQELANELVDGEDGRERYEAYGRVALHNGRPAPGSRPCAEASVAPATTARRPGRKPARFRCRWCRCPCSTECGSAPEFVETHAHDLRTALGVAPGSRTRA